MYNSRSKKGIEWEKLPLSFYAGLFIAMLCLSMAGWLRFKTISTDGKIQSSTGAINPEIRRK